MNKERTFRNNSPPVFSVKHGKQLKNGKYYQNIKNWRIHYDL